VQAQSLGNIKLYGGEGVKHLVGGVFQSGVTDNAMNIEQASIRTLFIVTTFLTRPFLPDSFYDNL
jgi:hypothetical protein